MKSENTILLLCAFSLVLSGCTTTTGTQQVAEVAPPTIWSTDAIAQIDVSGKISGAGCANEFLSIFHYGDNKFLEAYGAPDDSSLVKKAKAAAAYKALVADGGLTNDMLVYPVWHIHESRYLFGLLGKSVCAEVTGYRAVVSSFEKADTLTEPDSKSKDGETDTGGFIGRFWTNKD